MQKNIRNFKKAIDRRKFVEQSTKTSLKNISQFNFSEEEVHQKNIENLIGATQIPLGIAGPLKIRNWKLEIGNFYIPLATTEGALVASISRGCKAINESGGAKVYTENIGITRGPVLKTNGIKHSQEIKTWIEKHLLKLQEIPLKTSSHLRLTNIDFALSGKNLFLRFYFDSDDAMGMNMATIASEKIVELICQETKAETVSVAGNYDIDKKPAWLNFINGRGKKVWAEVEVPKKVVADILKTTPENICEVIARKIMVGSSLAGSMGFNAHFANILAAIFIATGQDIAHIVEGSSGITSAEVLKNGNLYFSIYLPSLICGIVGGGTNLPTQKEALNIIGPKSVLEFSQVIAGAILAGELSLIASQAQGTLAQAHIKLGRKNKK